MAALACSSTPVSTMTGPVQGELVLDVGAGNCDTSCQDENTLGAALAQGQLWLTRFRSYYPNDHSNSCASNVTFTDSTQLEVATFGADGGTTQVATSPSDMVAVVSSGSMSCANNPGMASGVGVTPDGTGVYFAYGTPDPKSASIVVQKVTPAGVLAGTVMFDAPGPASPIVGVIADTESAIVAVGPSGTNGGNDSDQGQWTFNNGGSPTTGGMIYALDFQTSNVTPHAATIDTRFSNHLFTADATNVYWVGGGQVWSSPRDFSVAPTQLGAVPSGSSCINNGCMVAGAVGLSVWNGVVAWSAVSGTVPQNGNGSAFSFTTGCTIWTSAQPATPIYQSASTGCMGLAIDGSSAYFAQVDLVSTSCGGTCMSSYVATTGLARVSLTGSMSQTPSIVPFNTQRMYGPRRFFVDDTYLYGIDPAYALRVAKTAFPP